MRNKFKKVPVEADTRIAFEQEMKLDRYDVLYQKWLWDGFYGESIIFVNEDVANMTDDEIKQMIKTNPILKEGSDITLKRTESGFTFVNFNFSVPID